MYCIRDNFIKLETEIYIFKIFLMANVIKWARFTWWPVSDNNNDNDNNNDSDSDEDDDDGDGDNDKGGDLTWISFQNRTAL